MMEQHYKNQQDIHQCQQEYWEHQQDTTLTQMALLSIQHSELIKTMKKVPLGRGNPVAVPASAIPVPKMLMLDEIKAQQDAVWGTPTTLSRIPTSLCEKIWSFHYIDLTLLIPPSHTAPEMQLVTAADGKVHLVNKPHIQNIDCWVTWYQMFSIHAQVLVMKYPNHAWELL